MLHFRGLAIQERNMEGDLEVSDKFEITEFDKRIAMMLIEGLPEPRLENLQLVALHGAMGKLKHKAKAARFLGISTRKVRMWLNGRKTNVRNA